MSEKKNKKKLEKTPVPADLAPEQAEAPAPEETQPDAKFEPTEAMQAGKGGRARLTKKAVERALESFSGNITLAASHLKVTRKTLYRKLAQYPDLKDIVEDAREELVDLAEGHITSKVNDGDTRACVFVLSTLGRNRGYVRKHEVTTPEDVTITIRDAVDCAICAHAEHKVGQCRSCRCPNMKADDEIPEE